MGHLTKIPHDIRKNLFLGILEYVIADCIQSFKRPCTYEEVNELCDEPITMIGECCEILKDCGFVQIAPKSGKLTVTKEWKERTKIVKEEKPVNPLIHLMHLAIIDKERRDDRTDYQWTPADAVAADLLSKKLQNAFEIKMGRTGENTEIIDSFCLILDNLKPFYTDGFSVGRINSDYNAIVGEVRAILRGKGKGKIEKTYDAIAEAMETFTPKVIK